jgi:UDP-N-acetylmuramate--alanine ligase
MSKLDLSKIKKVHFVGIGGIGISAVARMMKLEGKTVIANDIEEFEMVAELRKLGVDTKIGIKKEFVEADTDLYVYSIAWDTIGPKFLEYIRATGKPVLSYPEMLHIVTEGKYTIAVTGTHGKTTTTAMIGEMLMGLDKDPSIIVGSLLKDKNKGENSNLVVGQSDLFVVEGCEYRRSFLNISPKILVITNIEADHLDYYKDLQDVEKAFCEIMQKVPDDGTIILNEKLTARSTLLVQCAEKAMKRGVKMVDYMQYVDKVPTLFTHYLGVPVWRKKIKILGDGKSKSQTTLVLGVTSYDIFPE